MNSPGRPLAYHITFGTYGTRLHGDEKGTVDRDHSRFGDPFLEADADRLHESAERLKFPPVVLTREQCQFIESIVPSICQRGGWTYIVAAAAPDHVHVCLSAPDIPGDRIEPWLKRWFSEALSE